MRLPSHPNGGSLLHFENFAVALQPRL